MGLRDLASDYSATRARRNALIAIAATFAIFSALLGAMFYLRSASAQWPEPFHFASLLMAGAMTMFSLCASLTVAIGARALSPAEIEPAVRWVAIAIACWLTFQFLEVVEWTRLVYLVGLGPRTAFGGSYLALTASHWLAISACVCWMTYVAVDIRHRDVLAPAMYSHFLNLWWIVLLFALYFPNATLRGI